MTGVSGLLRAANARGNVLILTGLILGLLWPQAASFFRPILEPSIALLLLSSLVRMQWSALGAYIRRPTLPLLLSAGLVVISPALVWMLATLAGLPLWLKEVLFLASCSGPIVATPVFAQMLRLDAPLTVAAVVATTLAMPLSLPLLAEHLAGMALEIPPDAFLMRVAIFIVLPFLAAGLIKRLVPPDRLREAAPDIGGLTVILLIFFGLAVMDGAQARLLESPWEVLGLTAAAFGLNIALQIVAFVLFLPAGREIALTAALSAGNRNLGLVLGLLGAAAVGPDFLLFVAVGQLPIFLTPLLCPPVYDRIRRAGAG